MISLRVVELLRSWVSPWVHFGTWQFLRSWFISSKWSCWFYVCSFFTCLFLALPILLFISAVSVTLVPLLSSLTVIICVSSPFSVGFAKFVLLLIVLKTQLLFPLIFSIVFCFKFHWFLRFYFFSFYLISNHVVLLK